MEHENEKLIMQNDFTKSDMQIMTGKVETVMNMINDYKLNT